MRAPITDKHLLEMMWERFPEIMKRGAEQPARQGPVAAECNFVGTKEWGRCSIEHHNFVQSEPHKWPGYQTRLLYTSPPARQEPAFHGFMDEERCCVNICYTPWAPGGPNNELPTAYYTSPQPAQQEPVKGAALNKDGGVTLCKNGQEESIFGFAGRLFTSPPAQRTWVGLTDEEIQKEFHPLHATGLQFARAIEAKLKEKNGL